MPYNNPRHVDFGRFVRDIFDLTTEMQADIDERLVEGQAYNGNRINRTEGFVSETDDGNTKVTMSGTGGFQCWAKQGGIYVPVAALSVNGLEANRLSTINGFGYGMIGSEDEYDLKLKVAFNTLGSYFEIEPLYYGGMTAGFSDGMAPSIRADLGSAALYLIVRIFCSVILLGRLCIIVKGLQIQAYPCKTTK